MTTAIATPNTPWPNFFQVMFGAGTDQWKLTLATWAELFHAEGRSNSEMVSVIHGISRRDQLPKFPTDFLEAIRSELKAQDAVFVRKREDARLASLDQPLRCKKCRDVGQVTGLPHCQHVNGVNWKRPRYTQAVLCDCQMGEMSRQKWHSMNKPLMSWSEYVRLNPDWFVQLSMRKLEVDAEVAAHRQQFGAPDWAGIVQRMIDRNKSLSESA